jgi:hypothetical protein
MDPTLRVVTALPLTELWDKRGTVEASPTRALGHTDVREHLRGGTRGVIASVSHPLAWLHGTEFYDWWKTEAQSRLAAETSERLRLEDFPDERCWTATEWTLADGSSVLVFEEWH